ncbi:MAG: ROK family protein [Elusimicrobiota bacterium]
MGRDLYVGVDIGGTKILAALVDSNGRISARSKRPAPMGGGRKKVYKTVTAAIREVLGARRVKAIGVGVPGIVDSRGRVVRAPNIELSGVPLGRWLGREFGTRVAVGNDANLGLLGERWLGAGKGAGDLIGIFLGTGVGGGIVAGGRLVCGAHGAAAEFGHMLLAEDGRTCGCGNIGCLEAVASRSAIEADIRRSVKKGRKTLLRGLERIRSKALLKALRKKDPVARKAVRKAVSALARACVTLRHVFDPERIVFGGGLVEACGDYILPPIRKAVAKDPFFRPLGPCKIVPCELGDDAVVLGAVALARGK